MSSSRPLVFVIEVEYLRLDSPPRSSNVGPANNSGVSVVTFSRFITKAEKSNVVSVSSSNNSRGSCLLQARLLYLKVGLRIRDPLGLQRQLEDCIVFLYLIIKIKEFGLVDAYEVLEPVVVFPATWMSFLTSDWTADNILTSLLLFATTGQRAGKEESASANDLFV
ncbi:hypothetical protein Tco_0893116 [Tanacetum coccineum]|uniref:Uncharacterized protein n=1 Tax=Tanacetum coccineum TaxID=301880 RepID=A0ABQ5C9E4_9ASTR